jgi:hypothetical protein
MGFIAYRGLEREPSKWAETPGAPPATFGYAEKFIHPEHMKGAYRRMFLYFLFMEAELRSISKKLVKVEEAIGRNRRAVDHHELMDILNLRHRMTLAISYLSQPSLSTQLQGREMADLLASRFNLEEDWAALDTKVKVLEDMIETGTERDRNRKLTTFYYLGIPFAIATYLAASRPGAAPVTNGQPSDFSPLSVIYLPAYLKRLAEAIFKVPMPEAAAFWLTWLLLSALALLLVQKEVFPKLWSMLKPKKGKKRSRRL